MPVTKHRLSDTIEKVVSEHLKYDLIDDITNNTTWELLAMDGEMRIYRRELEEDGKLIFYYFNRIFCSFKKKRLFKQAQTKKYLI